MTIFKKTFILGAIALTLCAFSSVSSINQNAGSVNLKVSGGSVLLGQGFHQ